MPNTVGNHAVSAFTSPSNGDALNANVVKGNDNVLRSSYVNHDADPGIHLQSSDLASRPAAGTAGRKWLTTDSGDVRLWVDTGSVWEEVDYARTGAAATFTDLTVTGNTLIGNATSDTIGITAQLTTDLLPSTTDAVDVGSTSKQYRRVYTTRLTASGTTHDIRGVSYVFPSANGSANSVLTNNGSGTLSWAAAAGPNFDQQTFDSSGTWTKPSNGSMALIEVWGAGGSGSNSSTGSNRNGGAGGGYAYRLIKLSDLGSTETVTIGAGGSARTTTADGVAGGNSSFGSWATGYGGAGGTQASNTNFGGTTTRAGQVFSGTGPLLTTSYLYLDYWASDFRGGATISQYNAPAYIASAAFGGGAGASSDGSGNLIAAGTSLYGGNGGATATAGTVPAGGGGRGDGVSGGTSGAGAGGRVRITVW